MSERERERASLYLDEINCNSSKQFIALAVLLFCLQVQSVFLSIAENFESILLWKKHARKNIYRKCSLFPLKSHCAEALKVLLFGCLIGNSRRTYSSHHGMFLYHFRSYIFVVTLFFLSVHRFFFVDFIIRVTGSILDFEHTPANIIAVSMAFENNTPQQKKTQQPNFCKWK